MRRRRPDEAIELDQSLRQSRSIWLTLAIAAIPIAVGGLFSIYAGCAFIFDNSGEFDGSPTSALRNILLGVIVIAGDIIMFSRSLECGRRLKKLHEDPFSDVKPVPAPFHSTLFGPYH